jgi:hypothetical protein
MWLLPRIHLRPCVFNCPSCGVKGYSLQPLRTFHIGATTPTQRGEGKDQRLMNSLDWLHLFVPGCVNWLAGHLPGFLASPKRISPGGRTAGSRL